MMEPEALEVLITGPRPDGPRERRPRILVASFSALWSPHFAAELDIVARLLRSGTDCVVLTCSGQLAGCAANPSRNLVRCALCIERRRSSYGEITRSLPSDSGTLTFVSLKSLRTLATVEARDVPDELEYAALSSAVTYFGDVDLTTPEREEMVDHLTQSSILARAATLRILESHPISSVLIFNGRFAEYAGVSSAANMAGVRCFVHERSESGRTYRVMPFGDVHSLERIKSEVSSMIGVNQYDSLGHHFFQTQRVGGARGPLGQNRFVRSQSPDMLPNDFQRGKPNISVFVSSEDELYFYPEWRNWWSDTQVGALTQILPLLLDEGFEVWVRLHPNLAARERNSQLAAARQLATDRVHILEPDSSVSSYALAEASRAVLTFGSTFGAEAAYWGVRSILAGRSPYEHLGICHRAANKDELLEALSAPAIPNAHETALLYGASRMIEGYDFQYVRIGDNPTAVGYWFRSSPRARFFSAIITRFSRAARLRLIRLRLALRAPTLLLNGDREYSPKLNRVLKRSLGGPAH